MATIVEELVLYDRFTNTFTSYIAQGQKAANATQQTQKQIEEMGRKSASAASDILSVTTTRRAAVRFSSRVMNAKRYPQSSRLIRFA